VKSRKNLLLITLVASLFLSTTLTNLPKVSAQPPASLAVSPTVVDGIERNLGPGSTFSIEVNVDDVEAMLGYQIWLGYDTSVLTPTALNSYFPFTNTLGQEINDVQGYLYMVYTYPLPELIGLYTTDPLPVARIDFTVDAYGYSQLDLYKTRIMHISEAPIPHTLNDGSFFNIEIHDVAITGVIRNQTFAKPGRSISINVTAQNQGTFPDTFDVTAYANTTLIGTQTVTALVPKTSKILTFTWDTTGFAEATYTLSANASVVAQETDTADNSYTDGTVTVTSLAVHDIAITSVTATPTSVFVGQNMTIKTTVWNFGLVTETFNVTAYYDENVIETRNMTLAEGASNTLTFAWNTSSAAFGKYTIKANTTVVPDDINVTNNVFIDGEVIVQLSDLSLWSVTFSPTTVILGQNVTIETAVENQGRQNATFTVTAYYKNVTGWVEIGTQGVTNLTAGDNAYPSFVLNSTGVPLGTYLICANASVLFGEVDVADNSLVADGAASIIPEVHDIAVKSVTASPIEVAVGGIVSIDVTVENQGNMPETFDLSVRRNTIVIETRKTIALSVGESKTVPFSWNTTGITLGAYTMAANASIVSGETDTADNTKTDGTVTVGTRDLVILTLTVNPPQVAVGQSVTISVTVKNDGTFTETNINVTVYRDSIVIGTQIVASLPKAASKTLSFTWNTAGVELDTYTIKAAAKVVAGETNKENNVKVLEVTVKVGSTISITVASTTFTVGDSTTINGSITPNPGAGKTVTLSYRLGGEQTWANVTATTDANGQYSFEWKPTAAGTYEVITSWAGDSARMGDDSEKQTITVQEGGGGFPIYWVAGIAIVVIAIILIYVWRSRKP